MFLTMGQSGNRLTAKPLIETRMTVTFNEKEVDYIK